MSHPAAPLAAAAVAAKVHDLATAKPSSTPLITNPKAATASPEMPKEVKPADQTQKGMSTLKDFMDKASAKKEESAPKKETPTFGPTTEITKKSMAATGATQKVNDLATANPLQKSSTQLTTNLKIGDTTSAKIPEALKRSEQVQNETHIPQESTVLFRKVSTVFSEQNDLKKDENVLKKELAAAAAAEATKKTNLIQPCNMEKVPQVLPVQERTIAVPKVDTPPVTTDKLVKTHELRRSTQGNGFIPSQACIIQAPNFGQYQQPGGYSADMRGNQLAVQVPLSKDMNGSVSANPLEMIQLAGDLVVEACQFVSESGKYSSEVQKDTVKREIQQVLDAQIEANTKHKMIYSAMDGGFYDAAKVAEADTLFVQMQTLRVRSRLQGNDMTPEMRACNELYQATSDKYTEMYRQHGHLMRRSDEETREAASQAIHKALEYAKTAPSVSEKARTIAIKDCENQIRVRNRQDAEYKEVKAQAALGIDHPASKYYPSFASEKRNPSKETVKQEAAQIQAHATVVQPISESHVEQSREAKKPSKEQKIKQQAEQVATGSPNGSPKKDDKDPKERTTKVAKTANELKEKLRERVTEKFHRTEDFLEQTEFGAKNSNMFERTKRVFQGKRAFQAKANLGTGISKGEQIVMDALHGNHLEVYNASGEWSHVANFDGTINHHLTNLAKQSPRTPLG